jgi:hypothetical protein
MASFEITTNAASYFYEKLQPYGLERNLEFYVVNVLAEQVNSHPQQECLAFMLRDALNAEPSGKIKRFKQLGDHCLVFSGCFREFVELKTPGRRYYELMGRSAYNSAANAIRDPDFSHLYRQVGQSIHELSDLIHGILR